MEDKILKQTDYTKLPPTVYVLNKENLLIEECSTLGINNPRENNPVFYVKTPYGDKRLLVYTNLGKEYFYSKQEAIAGLIDLHNQIIKQKNQEYLKAIENKNKVIFGMADAKFIVKFGESADVDAS